MAPLLALALLLPTSPKDALVGLREHYQSLKTYQARIEHHDSSGLFPGNFEQSFTWKSPATFKLTVIKFAKGADRTCPNYDSDGVTVLSTGAQVRSEPVAHSIDIEPGWEVTGSFIMSWLVRTPLATFLETPPKQVKLGYSWGSIHKWQGFDVKDIALTATMEGMKGLEKIDFLVSPDAKHLIGISVDASGLKGYLVYRDQVEDGQKLDLK